MGGVAAQVEPVDAHTPVRALNRYVKEFWCLRSEGAFPGPEKAAAAVRRVLLEGWAGCMELRGAPVEVKKSFLVRICQVVVRDHLLSSLVWLQL